MTLTEQAKKIASSQARLLSHWDRIAEIRRTGFIRPITVHLAPTDTCNLNCEWCSVKRREGNELSFQQCKEILGIYRRLGAKSVEITGGGEPTMYPYLDGVVNHAKRLGYGVGLITNGLKLASMSKKELIRLTASLDWMRISLSGIDFGLSGRYFEIDPRALKTYVGASYVFVVRKTKKELLFRLGEAESIAKYLGAEYVRIVPNCFSIRDIERTRGVWQKSYFKPFRENKFFLQIKDYDVPQKCFWRYMKPFVNSDGFVYHCSTCALFEGRFPESHRVCHYTEVGQLYEQRAYPFMDTQLCKTEDGSEICFYTRQNQLIEDLLLAGKVKDKEFV